jgi:hypothetical protein
MANRASSNQAYLGTAEKVADLVKDRAAPVSLSATMRDLDAG